MGSGTCEHPRLSQSYYHLAHSIPGVEREKRVVVLFLASLQIQCGVEDCIGISDVAARCRSIAVDISFSEIDADLYLPATPCSAYRKYSSSLRLVRRVLIQMPLG